MFKLTVFCLLAFALGALALDGDRIVGGQQASRGQFPHQASLRRVRGRGHFCGGAIVSDRFVLTAAHCTQGRFAIPAEVRVAVGGHRIFDGTLHNVSRIVNHPRYNSRSMENDIAVIQTTNKIIFGPEVRAIALPTQNLPDETGIRILVSGFGQNRVSSTLSS